MIEVWQSLESNRFNKEINDALVSVFGVPREIVASPNSFGDPAELRRLLLDAGFHQVDVEPAAHDVHFRNPDRFVELTIRGAAAVVPAFAQLGGDAQAALQAKVVDRVEGLLREHTSGGVLSFPMYANFAVAVC